MEEDGELISKRNSVIIFVLNNAANKLPIKATDINQILGKQTKAQHSQVLLQVTKSLKKDYGIILEEISDQKSGKKFICYAEDSIKLVQTLDEEQKVQTTLLFIVLSYIFMSGGSVYEEQLEHFLRGLEIYYNEDHSYFGPVKKLITETFVKQLYLKKQKFESELDTEIKFLVEWGHRAHKEFPKMQMLETASTIMAKDAQSFTTQFETAQSEVHVQDEDVVMVEN